MIETYSKLDLVYMDLWMVFEDIGVKVRVDAGMNFSQRLLDSSQTGVAEMW